MSNTTNQQLTNQFKSIDLSSPLLGNQSNRAYKQQPDHQNKNKKYINKSKSNFNFNTQQHSSPSSAQTQSNIFEPYLTAEEVELGLKENRFIKSKLRINQRNYEDAYLSDPNDITNSDIYIQSIKDRNRALNGDLVVAELKEKCQWKLSDQFKEKLESLLKIQNIKHLENCSLNKQFKPATQQQQRSDKRYSLQELTCNCNYENKNFLDLFDDKWFQKTAKVVYIYEKKNTRFTAGTLKLFPDLNNQWALFSPNDSRLPRLKIKINECPQDFYFNSKFYEKTLFIAEIVDSPENSKFALGQLKHCLGESGNIKVETEAMLMENGIDFEDFDEKTLFAQQTLPWRIPEQEYSCRRDLRDLCIFTIDPSTARDLDDALHCIQLNENQFEVGVHIADVSYFVRENGQIDKMASQRTTSVYLVQQVVPMLPRYLCEHLCSLNPNEDRLTFSVIWKINSDGQILEEWFGRTVIKSAVKLSYENAQKFIDNSTVEFDKEEFPNIREKFNLHDIKTSVLNMHKIAKNLRAKRYEQGCLTLNQMKMTFILNKETFTPYGYSVYEQKDSNKLVEEFMLLANIAVAHRIYDKYPSKAILRRHPIPNQQQINDLSKALREYGYHCDTSTSNSIQTFLHEIERENTEESKVALLTLTCLLTKTMQLAQYFCSGTTTNKEHYYHYGLAVPLYTHFTSPIRRYPDILVHRLLAASLDTNASEIANFADDTYLKEICDLCNEKKYSARLCSERSTEMYFSLFINECGCIEEIGSVIQIKDHSFDVLINNLGITKRIYCDRLDLVENSIEFVKSEIKPELNFKWKPNEKCCESVKQTIKLFSKVSVLIVKHDYDPLKYNVILKHPNETILNKNKMKQIDNAGSDQLIYEQRIDIDPNICD